MKDFENLTDAQLDEMIMQKFGGQKTYEQMTDDELDQAILDQQATRQPQQQIMVPPTVSGNEADLGLATRVKYSIEPIESNRRALLQQQFGAENVLTDSKGDVFIRQGNELRPVNAPGFSFSDVADIAGAAPEAIGGVVGSAGSVPGAMLGSAVGAAARQGVSALLGTPQIAEPSERVVDVGISAAMGGLGQFVANKAKGAAKAILDKVRPKMPDQLDDVAKIMEKQGIGKPTLGQKLGSQSTVNKMEKDLADIPFFGRKYRKEFENQSKAVLSEIKKDMGDFMDDKFSIKDVGDNVKDLARSKVKFLHDTASDLFKQVDEVAGQVTIPGDKVKSELLNNAKKLMVVDQNGRLADYSARSGLDRETFDQVQGVLKDVIEAVNNTTKEGEEILGKGFVINPKARDITVKELNLIRQSVTNTLQSAKVKGTNAGRLLKKLENSLLDVTEKGIDAQNPGMGKQFKAAREGWKAFREYESMLDKSKLAKRDFGEAASERVISDMFSNSQKVIEYERLIGADNVREAATGYIQKRLRDNIKNKDYVTTGDILTMLKKQEDTYKRVFGKEKYNKFLDLLKVDQNLKLSTNPSGTATKSLRMEPFKVIKSGMSTSALLKLLNTGVELPEKAIKRTIQYAPPVQEKRREAGYIMRGPPKKGGFGDLYD